MILRILYLTINVLALTFAAFAQSSDVQFVTIHPLFAAEYSCSEHAVGDLPYPGDDIGSDCVVYGKIDGRATTGFPRQFKTDGSTNEDWYGWMEPVLTPFDGEVVRVNINPVTNKPGQTGKGPASFVIFKHDDGTHVMVAHLNEITVKVGDKVKAGKPFAKVGNNGFGRMPHIHVGAFREKTALQIRFDLKAKADSRKK